MSDLNLLLSKWKYARQIFDTVTEWKQGLEDKAKAAVLTAFNATLKETRTAQVPPGVTVREEVVVTLDLKTGEAAALVMGDILTYSDVVTLNEGAIMTLIGMIYSGKYPELQAALVLNESAYKAKLKKRIEAQLEKGVTLEEAVKLVNMPADSVTVKQTVAFTLKNLQVEPAIHDTDSPFTFLPRVVDPTDKPPF